MKELFEHHQNNCEPTFISDNFFRNLPNMKRLQRQIVINTVKKYRFAVKNIFDDEAFENY